MIINRREFIKSTGACMGAAAALSAPKVSFAGPVMAKKLIYITCPGGLDGFTLTPPINDPAYYSLRSQFAVPRPDDNSAPVDRRALYLSDTFGLHPRVPEMYGMFQRGEMTLFPNVNWARYGYNTGSHFNEIRRAENGMDRWDNGSTSLAGWVNRLLTVLEGENNPGAIAVTGNPVLPDVLHGPEVTAVYMPPGQTTSQQTDMRLRQVMGGRTLGRVYSTGFDRRDAMNRALNGANVNFNMFSNFWGAHVQAQIAGILLASDQQYAPSISILNIEGWDWHTYENNGWGYPAARLAHLSLALGTLVQTLKDRNMFQNTLIVVASEFGRPCAHNGVGTDHGHGQTGIIITGNPLLMAQPGQGIVLNGNYPGFASRDQWNCIRDNGRYQNIIRQYVAAHFNLTQAEIDFVLPSLNQA
ncbi:MAG: DUF1501 domain-containing protein [Alphaproteobacteria bacterium]|nr:MAG: DUF1501 domain-containing protein [Alphaproteobacteria bacterium]